MSWTLAQRRDALMGYAGVYNVPLSANSLKHLDLCIEWGRDEVFWLIFPYRSELFRASTAVAQGGAYPADHMRYANHAFYTYSAVIRQFRYASVPEIPAMKTNLRVKARDEEPVISFFDQTVNYLPAGIATATYEYFKYPVNLTTDATTDVMPEDTEMMIVRAAFERLVLTMLSEAEAGQLLEHELERWKAAETKLYDDIFSSQEVDIRRV